jgi:membrane protein YqaA with SNARE-associated domain
MRTLLRSLLSYFLTPAGLVALGVLDSSLVFFLPFGIDFVLIILCARRPGLFWLYALLATAGSVAGAALTFWIGRKLGKPGLARLIAPERLKRIERRVGTGTAAGIALLGVIPPPFPFTAFVLTSGAVGASPVVFLTALGAVRAARFMVEGALAARFGSQLLRWMESTAFEVIVGAVIVLAIGGTVLSAIAAARSGRRRSPARTAGSRS